MPGRTGTPSRIGSTGWTGRPRLKGHSLARSTWEVVSFERRWRGIMDTTVLVYNTAALTI
eukprot:1110472-Amorphochlora_amoeboformis.AAC.3